MRSSVEIHRDHPGPSFETTPLVNTPVRSAFSGGVSSRGSRRMRMPYRRWVPLRYARPARLTHPRPARSGARPLRPRSIAWRPVAEGQLGIAIVPAAGVATRSHNVGVRSSPPSSGSVGFRWRGGGEHLAAAITAEPLHLVHRLPERHLLHDGDARLRTLLPGGSPPAGAPEGELLRAMVPVSGRRGPVTFRRWRLAVGEAVLSFSPSASLSGTCLPPSMIRPSSSRFTAIGGCTGFLPGDFVGAGIRDAGTLTVTRRWSFEIGGNSHPGGGQVANLADNAAQSTRDH